jgi:hypothetical protein
MQVQLSSRMRRGWRVVSRPLSCDRVIHAPAALAGAPEEVKLALLQWAQLPMKSRRRSRPAADERKRQLERRIWTYLAEVSDLRPRERAVHAAALEQATGGAIYDLAEVRDTINERFFEGRVQTLIRWGSPRSTTSFHRTARDTDGNRVNLITVAGVYNHPRIPRFAIEALVFHEMLHIVLPPYRRNGRTVFHGPEFKAAERAFPHYAAWHRWEKTELPGIARAMRRKR